MDSALLWALVRHRLSAASAPRTPWPTPSAALRAAGAGGRFNFLLTDGRVIAATAAGDTLCYRASGHAVVVASEPGDDGPAGPRCPTAPC